MAIFDDEFLEKILPNVNFGGNENKPDLPKETIAPSTNTNNPSKSGIQGVAKNANRNKFDYVTNYDQRRRNYDSDSADYSGKISSDVTNTKGVIKDIIHLATDPKYLVYSLGKKAAEWWNGGFEPKNRIHNDMNDGGIALIDDSLNWLANNDPLKGTITTFASGLLGAYNMTSSESSNLITEELRKRRKLYNHEDLFKPSLTIKDCTGTDPAFSTVGTKSQFQTSFKGYKTFLGMTLGSKYLWDITLDNYFPKLVDPNSGKRKDYPTFAPLVPRVVDFRNKSLPVGNMSADALGNFIPATSFSYSDYDATTFDVEMTNGASLNILSGAKRGYALTIGFVDDEHLTWQRFFDYYFKCIYDFDNNCVAPYKQSVLLVKLCLYNVNNLSYFKHNLLVLPTGFKQSVDGEEGANVSDFEVEFSVVGDI